MLRGFIVITSFLCSFPTLLSQTSDIDFDSLDHYLEKMVENWNVPSMAIGVIQDGQLTHARGFGIKEVGKSTTPDEHTLYAIASNSKAFTSTLAAMLEQDGKLSWDDPVQKYLPYFEIYDPYISKMVTIRDLLCHRVGLGTFSGDIIWYKSDFTAKEIIERIRHLPAHYPFRSGYGYSNLMYITAGEVIYEITGESWAGKIKERIFTPLGMDRSIVGPTLLKERGNYATPHEWADGKNNPIPWVDWSIVAATGGIISSVADLSKWMIFNLQHGVWEGDTLLTPESRNLLWTPHNNFVIDHTDPNPLAPDYRGYALGWGIRDWAGELLIGHTGGFDGMLSAFFMLPDQKSGVIVLTNGMHSPYMAATYYVIDRLLGRPYHDWSAEFLQRLEKRGTDDTRIKDRIASHVVGTSPSLTLEEYTGSYTTDLHGDISIELKDGKLSLYFDRAKAFNADLEHWHHDVFKINWHEPSAWFSFGTVQFEMDNNLHITGLRFDVPNDDIFFEELTVEKINE